MAKPNSFLLGRAQYEVIASCVVVARVGAVETYVYRGGRLPSDASPALVTELLGQGMIRRITTEGEQPK